MYDAHNDQFNWRSHTSGISPLLMDFIDQLMARQPTKRPIDTEVILDRIKTIERQLDDNATELEENLSHNKPTTLQNKPDRVPVLQRNQSQKLASLPSSRLGSTYRGSY